MTAPSPRAQYVLDTYHLDRTPDGWRAWNTFEGRVLFEKVAATREEAVHYARCHWGHFNFEDEAEAFNTIFPR